MSNRFAGKVIVVDTTDTQVGGQNPDIGPTGPLSIRAIKWVGTQNSGKNIAQNDDLTILDVKGGTKIIECRAQEATPNQVAYSESFGGEPWIVSGLYFEDLDGGEVQLILS